MVLFIYRPEVYDKEDAKPEDQGIAEIIIGKQRNGPIGTVKLSFLHQYTRFENLAHGAREQDCPAYGSRQGSAFLFSLLPFPS